MDIFLQIEYVFNVFTDGATPVRPALFAAYVLLLLASLYAFRRAPERFSFPARVGAVITAGLMFLVTIAVHAVALTRHGIPLIEFAWFFDSAELTSTGIAHLHTGKSIIGATVGNLLPTLVVMTDTARALAAALPLWSIALMIFTTVTAVVLAIISYGYVSRYHEGRSTTQRFAVFVLYALTSFIVLIKMLDGGLLASAALLAFAVYASLLVSPKRLLLLTALGTVGALSVTLVFWAADIIVAIDVHHELMRTAALSAVIFALGATIRLPQYTLPAALLAVAVLVSASNALSLNERVYRSAPVAPAGSWVSLIGDAPGGFERFGGFGNLSVYHLPERAAFRTVGDVLETLPVLAAYRPVSPYIRACGGRVQRLPITFTLLVPDPLKRLSVSVEPFVDVSFTETGRDRKGWYRYQGSITYHPCLDSATDVLRETLREAGADGKGIAYRIRF